MEETQSSLVDRLRNNEDGLAYLVLGGITAVISWVLVPIAGLVSVYCGYKLYRVEDRLYSGSAIAAVGTAGVIVWVLWLATLS